MKRFYLTIAAAGIFISCQNNNANSNTENEVNYKEPTQEVASSPIDSLKNLVMDVHNETMQQMGEIQRLRKKLAAVKDTTNISTVQRDTAISNLQKAHEDMMTWMRSYKEVDNEEEWSEAKKADYLKAQKDQVEQLKEYTAISIEEAEQILRNQ